MFRFRVFALILSSVAFAGPAFAQSYAQPPFAQKLPFTAPQPTFARQSFVHPTAIPTQAYIQESDTARVATNQQPATAAPQLVGQQQTFVQQQQIIWTQPATQQPVWATQAVDYTQAQAANNSAGSFRLINGRYYQLVGGTYYRVDAAPVQTTQLYETQVQSYAQPATQLLAPPVQATPATSATVIESQPTVVDARYRTIHAVVQRSAEEVVQDTVVQGTAPTTVASGQSETIQQTRADVGEREFVDSWLRTQTDPAKADPNFELMQLDESLMASFAPTLLDHRQFVEELFETQRDASQSSMVAGWDFRETTETTERSERSEQVVVDVTRRSLQSLLEEEPSPSDRRADIEIAANDPTVNELAAIEIATFAPAPPLDADATSFGSSVVEANSRNETAGVRSDYFTSIDGRQDQRRRVARQRTASRRNASRRNTRRAAAWAWWIPALAILPLAWMFSRLWTDSEAEGQSYMAGVREEQDAAIMQRGEANREAAYRVVAGQEERASRGRANRGRGNRQSTVHHVANRRTNQSTSRGNVGVGSATADASARGWSGRDSEGRDSRTEERYASPAVSGFGADLGENANRSEFDPRYEVEGATNATEVPYQDFMRLEGIDANAEELLHKNGITHYWQLARTNKRQLRNLLDDAGPRFQGTNPGTWPKQAAFAMFGHWDELHGWLEERNSENTTMESRTLQSVSQQPQAGDCDTELGLLEEANSLQLSVDREMIALSEGVQTRNGSPDDSEAWAESRSSMREVREEVSPSEDDFKACDDLTEIQGIGPATESFLNDRGIYTFADLIEANVEELRRSLQEDDRFRNFEPRKWQREADEISKSLN